MIEPNKDYFDNVTPTVRLVGKDWPVPFLSPKQNRFVTPAVAFVAPKFFKYAGRNLTDVNVVAEMLSQIDTATYDALLNGTFWALKKAHPSLTFSEFEEWEISTMDLINCIDVLSKQTGLFKRKDASSPGEAQATGSSPTGT